jgi:hypothetical protein
MGAELSCVYCRSEKALTPAPDAEREARKREAERRFLSIPVELFGVKPPDEDDISELARILDVGMLEESFAKCAGFDQKMNTAEFLVFTQNIGGLSEVAPKLWTLMDTDRNGVVDLDEFRAAMRMLQEARSSLRFCPECGYRDNCAFCRECKACPDCKPTLFCPAHWRAHPANPENKRQSEFSDDDDEPVEEADELWGVGPQNGWKPRALDAEPEPEPEPAG